MTKLMEKAIAYMQRLDPWVQDELAQNILEDSFADLSEAERNEIGLPPLKWSIHWDRVYPV